jgi:hypothetical protein
VKLARHEEATAWFWRLAVPGYEPAMPRDEALRVALGVALDSSAGPAAGLAVLRRLLRAGALDPLLGALRFQDGPRMLRAFGWGSPRAPVPGEMLQGYSETPSGLLATVARRWLGRWGAQDARSQWLACVAHSIQWPAIAGQPELPQRALAWVQALIAEQSEHSSVPPAGPQTHRGNPAALSGGQRNAEVRPTRSGLNFDDESAATARLVNELRRDDGNTAEPFQAKAVDTEGAEPGLREHIDPEAAGVEALDSFASPAVGSEAAGAEDAERAIPIHTRWAGLFFLVPVMERLGMARWLEEHPQAAQWSLPALVLQALALRLEAHPGDPALASLGELPAPSSDAIQAMVEPWMRAMRRYSRRVARIGLRSLICRPGRIVFTETHIDVIFRLEHADIRVRRLGLDIDPGWVAWLGRVIRFHYLGGDYDA